MKSIKNVALGLIIACSAAPLFAGSITFIPPEEVIAAPVTPPSWSGPYIGALVSFESGNINAISGSSTGWQSNDADAYSETLFGVFAGYNLQFGKIVIGPEVAYTFGDFHNGQFQTVVTDGVLDLKGRVGFDAGRALIYGFAGMSKMGDLMAINYPADAAATNWLGNYGAGVEYRINDRIFVGAEYIARSSLANGFLVNPLNGPGPVNGFDYNTMSGSAISLRAGLQF